MAVSPRLWPLTPDWTNGVSESLAWETDVLQASASAATFRRSTRIGPRRRMAFEVVAENDAHRLVDMLLAGHRNLWRLPIWPDVQWLDTLLPSGSIAVPCRTDGFDFLPGGRALLYAAPGVTEVVKVAGIGADHIALEEVTLGAFGAGARLYPLRDARLQDGADVSYLHDRASRRTLAFDIAETCDWPALVSLPEYLGYPALDARPDESEDPHAAFTGLRETVDFGVALPVVGDLPGITLRTQSDRWKIHGRDRHTWFRSLLYLLRGRKRPVWVPSWSSDLQPATAIAGTTLAVRWAGYTQYGFVHSHRRDLRIELIDGTVFRRRIVATAEAGDTETLNLDAALGEGSIAPQHVRQISFLALCTLASDSTEISHVTDADGLANATTGWQEVVPDV